MVTSDRSIPINPSSEKAHSTPTNTASSGRRRHRTLKMKARMTAITIIAAMPSVSMPPLR